MLGEPHRSGYILVGPNCDADSKLFTSAMPGVLDDSGTGQRGIVGIKLTVRGGAGAKAIWKRPVSRVGADTRLSRLPPLRLRHADRQGFKAAGQQVRERIEEREGDPAAELAGQPHAERRPRRTTGRRKPMLANDLAVKKLHALYCDEMLARRKHGPKLSNLGNMYDVARMSAPVVVPADARHPAGKTGTREANPPTPHPREAQIRLHHSAVGSLGGCPQVVFLVGVRHRVPAGRDGLGRIVPRILSSSSAKPFRADVLCPAGEGLHDDVLHRDLRYLDALAQPDGAIADAA